MTTLEVNFPRGGTKTTLEKTFHQNSNHVATCSQKGNESKNEKSRKRKSSVQLDDLESVKQNEELYAAAADLLTYKKLQEQMLLLGCIRQISQFALDMDLPGKMGGTVKIASISGHYTTLLRKGMENNNDVVQLKEMFHIGQHVPTKVIEKNVGPDGTKVVLSVDPQNINAGWDHTVFKKGLLVWAAVASQLDHGYQLDAAVANSRIFLPFNNMKEGTKLVCGQPLWCVVQHCDTTSAASNIKVSILEKHLKASIQNDLNLHYLIPGMQFKVTIKKSVNYGLQGEFMNDHLGYINQAYLATPFEKPAKYKKGQVVRASLLYVQPTINLSHFTLKNIQSASAPQYNKGSILRAKVVSRANGGLNIKLPNKQRGFVADKRLLKMVPAKKDFGTAINRKFPPDSSHNCRVLDYNYLEQVYICTFESSVLKEKYFTVPDVKIGELVSVKVKTVTREGIQVTFGNLSGFIQNIHLSDALYSENIKKKFSVGKTLNAKVLNIDHKGVYFTLKKGLINSESCLCTYDTATVNQQYPGVIVNRSHKGILVIFYNNVRGLLSKKHLNQLYPDYTDDMFYDGQVIMPTVRHVRENILHLSMGIPKRTKYEPLLIGDYVNAVVTAIDENGLQVETVPSKIPAIIPTAHLSSSLMLTPLLKQTYKVGDELRDLLCVSIKDTPILSQREAVAYKEQNLEVGDIADLEIGSLIRCWYERTVETGAIVCAPFTSGNVKFRIPNEELLDQGDDKLLQFEHHQAIVAKVLQLDVKCKKITNATAKQSAVFNGDYKYSLNLWRQYLEDVEKIQAHNQSPLAELQLGQRVECVVSKMTDKGCKVLLKNNVKGFVSVQHYSKNMELNKKQTGVVLWVNYVDEYVEISLKEKVREKVNEVQGGVVSKRFGATLYADLLVEHFDYVVAVLRNLEANQQLIFLPSRFHENAFLQRLYVEELSKIKVILCGNVGKKLIGMNKAYIHALKNAKRKRSSQISTCHKKRARLDVDVSTVEDESNEEEICYTNEDSVDNSVNISYDTIEEVIDSDDEEKVNHEESSQEVNGDEEVDYEEESSDEENDCDEVDEETGYEDMDNEESNESSCEDAEFTIDSQNVLSDDLSSYEDDVSSEVDQAGENEQNENSYNEDTDTSDEGEENNQTDGNGSDDEDFKNQSIISIKDSVCVSESDESAESNSDLNELEIHKSVQNGIGTDKFTNVVSALPGVKHFFSESKVRFDQETSSDEDIPDTPKKEKQNKLTPAERKELAKLEEEELRRKEIENADPTREPQTVEQFQRLVKGKPNCSLSWSKYIAYLVANTELEKARSVIKEALQTIDMQETEERKSIWMVWLNFENRYGDKPSFNEVFEEAVRCNDPLTIYLSTIQLLANLQKFVEMEEKIQKAKSKFGQRAPNMWIEIGRIYYTNGKLKEARNLKDAGILKLNLKSYQIQVVVQFAIMEFTYGERNHGEALFETLLQHNPKRVDIWTTYVDQVIKKQDFECARRILERAVAQNIPAKKLKVLFTKYKNFETAHGTPEGVEHVKELARKYANLDQN